MNETSATLIFVATSLINLRNISIIAKPNTKEENLLKNIIISNNITNKTIKSIYIKTSLFLKYFIMKYKYLKDLQNYFTK